ncbi:MAG: phosphodiester glycosidase family protein [Acidobacteria bacterium]|nr:phosphodiester glycosidase family protein [Acidobacteriota bacterium]
MKVRASIRRQPRWNRTGWPLSEVRVADVTRALVAATVVVGFSLLPATSSGASPGAVVRGVPEPSRDGPATALHIFAMSGRQFGVTTPVHVLTFGGSRYKFSIDLAKHAVDNGVQTPSSMCRTTVGCVAAVNGDFFNMTPPGTPDPADSVGGIIRNCVLLHTPQISHQQVDLVSQTVSQDLNWSATVDVNGTGVPITAINQELPMSYAGVHLPLAGTLLYTPAYALRTAAAVGRMTFDFVHLGGGTSPTRINTTARLQLVARTMRPLKVRPGHVAISTDLWSPLATLATGAVVTLSTTSTAGCDNIGGHPILIDHGVVASIDPADTFLAKPYARTAIGWTTSGRTVVMTVDGKDGVSGATARQLVGLLESLHVVTAIALDGGNSTTLYATGRVLNHPPHGRERPVSTGLLIVKNP